MSGDEPSYVSEAYAIGRLHTWNLDPALNSNGLRHLLGPYSALNEVLIRHGVQFSDHAMGFSALLSPSLMITNSLTAMHLNIIAIMSALVIWIGIELTKLSHVQRIWLLLPVALFLAPGYLLATTQIYPDMLSGLIIAVTIIRLMIVERDGPSGLSSSVITAVLLFSLVCIDNKNIIIGVLIAVVAALVSHRNGASNRDVTILVSIVLVGVIGVTSINLYAYGHLLGPTQNITPFSGDSFTKVVALIFDRRHGIIVQTPLALLGLVGAARWWRRTPWSVTVGIAAVAILVVANASLVGGMNGGSFVGRYQWEALPLALAFAGLIALEFVPKRLVAATVLISVSIFLAVIESWALVTSRPNASSFLTSGWDPATYVGWWGRLDPSPILNYLSGEWTNARNLWGIGVLVALSIAVVDTAIRVLSNRNRNFFALSGAVVIALFCWVMALTSPFLLPAPLQYAASDLGRPPFPIPSRAVVIDGPRHGGKILSGPHLDVLPGRYRVYIVYALADSTSAPARFEVRATPTTGQSLMVVRNLPKSPNLIRRSVELNVTSPGTMSVYLTWRGNGRLTVSSVTFSKISTCRVVECQGGWL